MFWIHLPDQDYWRLVIGSPIVPEQGGLAVYGLLGVWLRQIELAGVTLADISVFDPESPEFQSLFSLARASSRLASGAAWLELEEAVVYRWNGAAIQGELTCDVSLDELNRIWQDERRMRPLHLLPALLISLEQRRVTLRFHPQHGTLGGIEGMKPYVADALSRARPDCQINWL